MRHTVAQKLLRRPLNSRNRLRTIITHIVMSSTRITIAVDISKSSPQIHFPKAYVL